MTKQQFENLAQRIQLENECVILTIKSTATDRQIEILKKMYPNCKIIKEEADES